MQQDTAAISVCFTRLVWKRRRLTYFLHWVNTNDVIAGKRGNQLTSTQLSPHATFLVSLPCSLADSHSLHRPQMTWQCPNPSNRFIHADPRSPTFDSKVEKQREQHPSCWTLPLPRLHTLDLMVVLCTPSATPLLIQPSSSSSCSHRTASLVSLCLYVALSSLPSLLLCFKSSPACFSSFSCHTTHTPPVVHIRGGICKHAHTPPVLAHQMFLTEQGLYHMIEAFHRNQLHIATAQFCPQDGRSGSESNSSILCTQHILT